MAASIPSVNYLACKLITLPKPSRNLNKNALFPLHGTSFSAILIRKTPKTTRNFTVRAAIEGDGEADNPATFSEVVAPPTEIEVLKKQLFESFYETNRGLSASSETRAEIVELITQLESKNPNPAPTQALTLLTQLESKNPNPAPTQALTLLNGKWILAYTSFLGFYPLLSREGAFSLVKVEEISQTIDSDNFSVQNSVLFSGPLTTTSVTTNAKFEVRSPKRFQIKFDEGVIGTPQLTDSIVLPENLELFGQNIDLAPFKGLLTSLQDTASSVARTISSQPPLKFSISDSNAQSWLLTTYLDHELRVSRGDGGSIFVLTKDPSPLLSSDHA